MTTKKKGIAVVNGSGDVAFKFLDDGTSVIGKDENSVHSITGTVNVEGKMDIQGSLSLSERIGGYKFGLPSLNEDGTDDSDVLEELRTNENGKYNGFMFYLNASSSAPFDQEKKIYFCENGTWFPSPFISFNEGE